LNKYHLTHLKELEAESIYVIREVVAQFENPVLTFFWRKRFYSLLSFGKKGILSCKCTFSINAY
jgi:sulfate adenylyltransferase subunit 2